MNEKIKELMIEAGYAAPIIAVRAQVLAELIVRECAEFIGGEYGYSEGVALLEHFELE